MASSDATSVPGPSSPDVPPAVLKALQRLDGAASFLTTLCQEVVDPLVDVISEATSTIDKAYGLKMDDRGRYVGAEHICATDPWRDLMARFGGHMLARAEGQRLGELERRIDRVASALRSLEVDVREMDDDLMDTRTRQQDATAG